MNVTVELAALERMTVGELTARYAELTGQPVRSRNRPYLLRKVAWRVQAAAEGDLSERALKRAAELANDADARLAPPKAMPAVAPAAAPGKVAVVRDPRLPAPGDAIERQYKGRTLRVVVRSDGFEYEGQFYRTLSLVAKAITGSHLNGFRFFKLGAKR